MRGSNATIRCHPEEVALHGRNDCQGRALNRIAQKEERGEQSGRLARVKQRERWRCAPIIYVGAGSSDPLKGARLKIEAAATTAISKATNGTGWAPGLKPVLIEALLPPAEAAGFHRPNNTLNATTGMPP